MPEFKTKYEIGDTVYTRPFGNGIQGELVKVTVDSAVVTFNKKGESEESYYVKLPNGCCDKRPLSLICGREEAIKIFDSERSKLFLNLFSEA